MPKTESIAFTVWTCVACGRVDKVESDGEHEETAQHFSGMGRIEVHTVGRDYQGGIVGPGFQTRGDLCDACVLSLVSWVHSRAGVKVSTGEPAWKAGDPCRSCGSTRTYVDDDGNPACKACGRNDGDEA